MHFLLWTTGSHKSTNFDTFKCFDENLINSSCHFPNHKSVFLQNLDGSSVSWKYLQCLLFLGQKLYTLHEKDQSKCKFWDWLWVLGSKFTKFLAFLKQQMVFSSSFAPLFSIIRQLFCAFSAKFYILLTKGAYQSTNFVKFRLSSRKS